MPPFTRPLTWFPYRSFRAFVAYETSSNYASVSYSLAVTWVVKTYLDKAHGAIALVPEAKLPIAGTL